MPRYGFVVRQYHRNRKAEFLKDYPAEARAVADLLGPPVKTMDFDMATISSDPSVSVEFRTKEGRHAVWVKVTPVGDALTAAVVLDQRPTV